MIKLVSREDKEFDFPSDLLTHSETLANTVAEFPNQPIPLPIETDILQTIVEAIKVLDQAKLNILKEPIFISLYQSIKLIKYDNSEDNVGELPATYTIPLLEAANYLDLVPLIDVFTYLIAHSILPNLEYLYSKGEEFLNHMKDYEPINLALEEVTGTKRISATGNFFPDELMRYLYKHLLIFVNILPSVIEEGFEKTVADDLTLSVVQKPKPRGKHLYGGKLADLPSDIFAGLLNVDKPAKLNYHNLTSFHGIKDYPNAATYRTLILHRNKLIDPFVDTYPINSPFINFKELTQLDLGGNLLINLPADFLNGLFNLTDLKLDGNELEDLDENLFKPCPHLLSINLSGNRLSSLPVNIFINQDRLGVVNLFNNRFEEQPKFNLHPEVQARLLPEREIELESGTLVPSIFKY